MSNLAPPPPGPPPELILADDDGLRRLRFRMWQIGASVLIVLVTVWFFTLGPIPGILALLVAKHLLVAILLMGLGVDARRRPA